MMLYFFYNYFDFILFFFKYFDDTNFYFFANSKKLTYFSLENKYEWIVY